MASLSSVPHSAPAGHSADSHWRRFTPWANIWRQEDALNLILMWTIRLGVVLLFLTPLIVTTSTVFPFVVGKAVWSRSLIEIIAGLYVLLAIRVPEFRPTRSRLVMLLGLHLAAVFIAGVFGSSFNLSFWSSYERMGGIFDQAHWVTLAAVLVFTVRELREWKALASVSLIFGLAAAFMGLAEKFDYDVVSYLQDSDRISGATGNPSFLAGHMMVNASLALALLGDKLKTIHLERTPATTGLAAFYFFTAAVSVWVLSETGTKGSMIGLLVGLIVAIGLYAVFSGRRRVRFAALAITVAVPIAVIVLLLARDTSVVRDIASRSTLVNRVVTASLDDGSLSLRASGLRISGEAFLAKPVTGWGGENFEVPFQRYQRDGEIPAGTPILDRAHNKALDLLATTGIAGFATYLLLWGWIGALAWRRLRHDAENRILHAGVAGALAALLIHELFLFDTAVTVLLFALLVAWAAGGEGGAKAHRKPLLGLSGVSPRVRSTLRWAAPVVVGLAVVTVLVGVNLRMYRAAQLITQTAANVQEVTANLDEFGPLATYGRERLLNVMSDRWNGLDGFEKIELVPDMERVAEQALAAEPNNMNLHFAVARFYREAASNFPELMERARFHTDRGAELGPHTVATTKAVAAQLDAEAALSTGTPQS